MRVLVHALAARRFGGAARHLQGFLCALEDWAPDVEFRVFVDEEFLARREDLSRGRASNVTITPVRTGSAAWRVYWDQVTLPRLAREWRADAVWSILGFGPGWNPGRVRIVNFQRTPTYYCPDHLKTLGPSQRVATRIRRSLQYVGMRAARYVVTPTDGMAAMVRRVYPQLSAGKFVTIPHAFDAHALHASKPLPAEVETLLPVEGDGAMRILYVGHLLPYKGIDTLLEALALARVRSPRALRVYLTIAREDWPEGYRRFLRRRDELRVADAVAVLGKVPEGAVAELYRRADVLFFPSLCESFGWPVMEAMSLGLPILAVATAVNREQLGDAGLYYGPGDAEAAAGRLVQLAGDDQLAAALAQRGRERVEGIGVTWEDYVRRCLDVTLWS